MLPGVGQVKQQIARASIDDKAIIRPEAIIRSMTTAERRNPKILNGSRRRRIAAGSGTSVQDVNRVLKQYQQMSTMMKKMGKLGKKGLSRGGGFPGAMMPPLPPGPIKL
jgi:signal recognition particle subunit SRP54